MCINHLSVFLLCQIFTLPKDTLVYPAHDYRGFTVRNILTPLSICTCMCTSFLYDLLVEFQVSTVGEEMLYNPRLTKDEVHL